MISQALIEYLLLVAGVTAVVLVIGGGLISTADYLLSVTKGEANVPLPVPPPVGDDNVPPSVSLTPDFLDTSVGLDVSFTCTAADDKSGISLIEINSETGHFTSCTVSPCTLTFTADQEGFYTVVCTAYDGAGNSSSDVSYLTVFPGVPPPPLPPPSPIVPIPGLPGKGS